MKFVMLPEFEDVNSALNFDTADCHVVGGCDLYTTKAAGADKKLYKNIQDSLNSQHESALKFGASLSGDPAAAAACLNLSRSSPFGSLSQTSARRTYAYLIATLNASHADYDFSHLLRPTDFKRERSLKTVVNTLDTALSNLRPRRSNAYLSVPNDFSSSAFPPSNSQAWGARMWKLIDNEMTLKECSIYCYSPDEDPYEAEDGAIWSYNYFFFNSKRKRVCYIYLRGISIMSHSPYERTSVTTKRSIDDDWATPDDGATKRARYWLGEGVNVKVPNGWSDEEEQGEEVGRHLRNPIYVPSDEEERLRSESKSTVRGISEDIAETMEV